MIPPLSPLRRKGRWLFLLDEPGPQAQEGGQTVAHHLLHFVGSGELAVAMTVTARQPVV